MTNFNFESGLDGWTPWIARVQTQAQSVDLNIESKLNGASDDAVFESNQSLRIVSHSNCYWAGVSQVVTLPPGTTFRWTVTGKAWASQDPNAFPKKHEVGGHYYVTAGAQTEPGDALDPLANDIRWGYAFAGADDHNLDKVPYPVWTPARVTGTVGPSGKVVLLAGMDLGSMSGLAEPVSPQYPFLVMVGFIDGCSLEVSGDGGIPSPEPASGGWEIQIPAFTIRAVKK